MCVCVRERADGERLSEILCSSNHLFFPATPASTIFDFRTFTDDVVVVRSPTHYQKDDDDKIIFGTFVLSVLVPHYIPIWIS